METITPEQAVERGMDYDIGKGFSVWFLVERDEHSVVRISCCDKEHPKREDAVSCGLALYREEAKRPTAKLRVNDYWYGVRFLSEEFDFERDGTCGGKTA